MRVGYIGPFTDSNLGDYSMLINDMLDFQAERNTVFLHAGSNTGELTKRYLPNENVIYQKVTINEFDGHERLISDEAGYNYITYSYTPFEIVSMLQNKDEVEAAIEECDLIVAVGGGYFNDLWNTQHRKGRLYSILALLALARRRKKHVVIMGATYGPFHYSESMFANFFAYLDLPCWGLRDNLFSPNNLRKLGLGGQTVLLPDDLYFVNPIFARQDIQVSPPSQKYIVLELYSPLSVLEPKSKALDAGLKAIKSRWGLDVVFLPCDVQYGGERQGQFLKDVFPQLWTYEMGSGHLPLPDAISIIKGASFVVCERYHLFLLAVANNVPAVQLLKTVCGDKQYYYGKSLGLLKEVLGPISIDENLFFSLSIENVLAGLADSLDQIASDQKLYFGAEKERAEQALKKNREAYIKFHQQLAFDNAPALRSN